MSPVLHYIMGGIDINAVSEICKSNSTANCRLGQIARQLAPYQTIVSVDPTNQKVHLEIFWVHKTDYTWCKHATLRKQYKDGKVEIWKCYKQYTPPVQAPQASPSQAPAPEKKAYAPTREKKEYTAEEVAKHNKENG
ncbi:hypothetical protein C2G38_2240642 [Gigaspora rosea]|uniref:Uncharacterized protein n=1 Tax=Gigaspora rosea TaxID=44941 RepID=A0A397VVP2_9GLOM|nr:hypothetical protein C2G38_2162761 [Gigaspora rosea]RIB26650.1 hypothetical protein C2G38_2240642 [Gigaspora rosea]